MVGAVVAEFHLHGAGTAGQSQQLMAKADAEHRDTRLHQLANRLDGVVAGFRVAGAVGKKNAVRFHGEHLGGRGLCRHHRQPAAAVHHMPGQIGVRAARMTLAPDPAALAPGIAVAGRHFLRQVHALEPLESPGLLQRLLLVRILPRQQAAVLGALFPEDAGQSPGIDVGNGDDAALAQVVGEPLLISVVAGHQRQVANHQPGGPDVGGLLVLGVGAGIADMRIGQGDNLARIGGVGQDLLVAGHGGVEHHLTH